MEEKKELLENELEKVAGGKLPDSDDVQIIVGTSVCHCFSGGIVGYDTGSVQNSYNVGDVTGENN